MYIYIHWYMHICMYVYYIYIYECCVTYDICHMSDIHAMTASYRIQKHHEKRTWETIPTGSAWHTLCHCDMWFPKGVWLGGSVMLGNHLRSWFPKLRQQQRTVETGVLNHSIIRSLGILKIRGRVAPMAGAMSGNHHRVLSGAASGTASSGSNRGRGGLPVAGAGAAAGCSKGESWSRNMAQRAGREGVKLKSLSSNMWYT